MSSRFTKLFTLAISILMALSALLLTGCGSISKPTPGPGGDTDNPGGDPVTSDTLRIGIQETTEEKEMMQAVIKAYQEHYPDEKISVVSIQGDYAQKIVNQASSGELPDVFTNLDSLVGYLAKANVTLALDDYLAEANISKDDFYPSVYNLGIYNGKTYMLPREYSHVVVYYNKTMLREAGVDLNPETTKVKNGWTWADFIEVAQKCVKKVNNQIVQYGADLQLNWPTTVMSYLYGKGGTLFSDDKMSCTIDDQKTVAAYQELKGYVDSGAITNVFKSGAPTFLSQSVAMFCSVRPKANIVNKTLGDDWDVVSFPAMENVKTVGSGTVGYSVSNLSDKKERAVRFLMYMMSEEGMNVMASTGLVVPSRIALNTADAAWRNYPNANINQDAFIYQSENDMDPLCIFLNDPSKTVKVTDALNLATESILAGKTDYASYKKSITDAMNN